MSFCHDDKHLQVVAHLYRGEMNRMTIYRQRLDMISTWSMTLLATLSVTYINTGLPFRMILLFIVPILFFSCMEARRYRYYCISRHRIRLLEKGFYLGDILETAPDQLVVAETRRQLMDSLREPAHVISFVRAWSIRFYRNYLWFSYFIGISLWYSLHPLYIRLLYTGCLFLIHGIIGYHQDSEIDI